MADDTKLPRVPQGSSPATPAGANGPTERPAPQHPSANPSQIVLNPTRTQSPPQSGAAKPPDEIKDSFREVVETIVFVVVLVLLLKTFLAEAFVIPTGSMATTLLGYHYPVTCVECGYSFPVNASTEADPQGGEPQPVISCDCPNCGKRNELPVEGMVRGGNR
jgi:hypothetical protein